MNFDRLLDQIGQFGKWQSRLFFYASLCCVIEAFLTLNFSFIGYVPPYRCDTGIASCEKSHLTFEEIRSISSPKKKDGSFDGCRVFKNVSDTQCNSTMFDTSVTELCTSHVFDNSQFQESLTQDFDIPPCGQDWPLYPTVSKSAFIGMCYMTGLLLGSFFGGVLSDKYGRRKTLFIGVLLSGVFSLGCIFVQNWWQYAILRLFTGIFSKFLFMLAFLISVEVTGPDYKVWLGILIQVPYALGEMLLAGAAYLSKTWRVLQIVTTVLAFASALLWFVMPESPRWFIAVGKNEAALDILQKGAKINGVDVILDKSAFKQSTENKEKRPGFMGLFHTRFVATNTLVMCFNWIVTNICYYGLILNSVNLAGSDIYANFSLSAAIEIPSYVFTVLVIDRVGRKPLLVFCQLLAGVTCIIAGYGRDYGLILTMTLLGKFGASACFSIVYLYTAELYPTELRGSAVGLASTFGRLGGIVAPLLASIDGSLPYVIMGGSALAGGILAILLPETLGTTLPINLDDVKNLSKGGKPWWKVLTNKELEAIKNARRAEQGLPPVDKPSASTISTQLPPKNPNLLKVKQSPGFAIPEINVVLATPQGSLRSLKPKTRPPVSQSPPRVVTTTAQVIQSEPSAAKAPSVTTAQISHSEPLTDPPSQPEIVIKVEVANEPERATLDGYPEYQPIRRLSEDIREQKKRVEEEQNSAEIEVVAAASIEETPVKEKVKPVASLDVLADEASRKFSQLDPAPIDSPNVKMVGSFAVIPTEKPKQPVKLVASLDVLSDEASRRFSKLEPAPIDSPSAKQVGSFSVIPTEKNKNT